MGFGLAPVPASSCTVLFLLISMMHLALVGITGIHVHRLERVCSMPKQRALRQFKAALFEMLSHPVRIALMKRLKAGEMEAKALIDSLRHISETDAADHLAVLVGNRMVTRRVEDGRIYYRLKDPSLGEVMDLFHDGAAWPVALAHAARIEILQFLAQGGCEQGQLIAKLDREDRSEALHHLEALVSTGLVMRRMEGQRTFYSLAGDVVPQVLKLLREYFEAHLVDSLLLVSQISFQHIHEEAAQLKARLAPGAAKGSGRAIGRQPLS
jgi:ArsR family transcriptional regulator